jgi:PleD family two-component response regulator
VRRLKRCCYHGISCAYILGLPIIRLGETIETVLVVDDEKNKRELIKPYLTDAGYRVLNVLDDTEALRLVRADKPF